MSGSDYSNGIWFLGGSKKENNQAWYCILLLEIKIFSLKLGKKLMETKFNGNKIKGDMQLYNNISSERLIGKILIFCIIHINSSTPNNVYGGAYL